MKIELERERVEAAKMEAHAAAMKIMNEATHLSFAKMSQESKILMADMATMYPLARVWHEMYRERIGKEVLAAEEVAAASVTTSTPMMFMPPSVPVEPVSAMEVPQAIADKENVVEVELPMMPFM
jgi:hypothetical protein